MVNPQRKRKRTQKKKKSNVQKRSFQERARGGIFLVINLKYIFILTFFLHVLWNKKFSLFIA
jgi:hypothetical protein